jgi:hypothetical protein
MPETSTRLQRPLSITVFWTPLTLTALSSHRTVREDPTPVRLIDPSGAGIGSSD